MAMHRDEQSNTERGFRHIQHVNFFTLITQEIYTTRKSNRTDTVKQQDGAYGRQDDANRGRGTHTGDITALGDGVP